MTITAQEILVKVATHLFRQGTRSMNDSGLCANRGYYGRSCAVGCLLDDDTALLIDGLGGGVSGEGVVHLPDDLAPHLDLLQQLQYAHDLLDNWVSSETMRHELRSIARRHGLDETFLDALSFSPDRPEE